MNDDAKVRRSRSRRARSVTIGSDPHWYKDAIVYELHVRAFADSTADGVGDFRGLTQKLDYLQQLGVTAIWLLPFYPSPLRDDGYDIADYHAVHPRYGTLKDSETFLHEAHRRGLRVITELVVNHTSDQHPWFQRARRAKPGSSHRDFYVWSDTPDRYKDARIIFKDFEHSNWAYDQLAGAYYWHRFYSHQPDLNYDNPAVREAVIEAMDFWLDMGVDGMRLDAVPYLFERDGTDCENLPETHAFLRELRAHVDRKYGDRMLLAEANQWPEDAAAYFGAGDECHMNFHFPLMPRLFMALRMEDTFPITDILTQTPPIPETSQWALFLRNHDELTLEMVTDEERDYMYRFYALDRTARINLGIRRRLAPLLGNNRRAIEAMNALLFALPGTPFIYYGDEIGMGDNIYLGDRNGVRTPMQWSSDRNAGFSQGNPQGLYLPIIIDPEYHYETVNVDAQNNNLHSLLWWMRRLIALRKRHRAFGRGSIEFLPAQDRSVIAFVRRYDGETILVVASMSRFVRYARLDLHAFTGLVPVEMLGRTEFPPITDQPYLLTLGPHSFYWFVLEPQRRPTPQTEGEIPLLQIDQPWHRWLLDGRRAGLVEMLPRHLRQRRWFGGKGRTITGCVISAALPLERHERRFVILLIDITYTEGTPETYQLPLMLAKGAEAETIVHDRPQTVLCRLSDGDGPPAVLCDATTDPHFARTLIDALEKRRHVAVGATALVGVRTRVFGRHRGKQPELAVRVLDVEQSNTSVVLGDRLITKVYRKVEFGLNPDVEVGLFLTERRRFPHTPDVAGYVEYEDGRRGRATLAVAQVWVPNQGDAWRYAVDEAERCLERAASSHANVTTVPVPKGTIVELSQRELPQLAVEVLGPPLLEAMRVLGRRTAEMHSALASDDEDPEFKPEPFTPFYRRSLYQSLRNLTHDVFTKLRRRLPQLDEPLRARAVAVADAQQPLLDWLAQVLRRKIRALRTRTHGDFHLGQVLHTGRDFVITDFEGEPARPLGERRLKRSPLRDVAGMLRSFHYAAYTALQRRTRDVPQPAVTQLHDWAHLWRRCAGAVFLREYLERAHGQHFLGGAGLDEITTLLDVFRVEKVVYELGYEIDNRPDWVGIPLDGLAQILVAVGVRKTDA